MRKMIAVVRAFVPALFVGALLSPIGARAAERNMLYVSTLSFAGSGGAVFMFDPYGKNTSPLGSVTFATGFPYGVWTDRTGRVYVTVVNAGAGGRGYINVYTPGLTKLLTTYTAGLDGPSGGTFDNAGNMYVSNLCGMAKGISCGVIAQHGRAIVAPGTNPYPGYVAIYPPGKMAPTKYLVGPINIAVDVALDRGGDVYVANNTGKAAWNVIRFPAGTTKGYFVPFIGLPAQRYVGALTFDPGGDLVVEINNTIDFFPTENGQATKSLTQGYVGAGGMAFGPDGTLFAGNYVFRSNDDQGDVIAYPPGAVAPARTYVVPKPYGVVGIAVGHL